MEEEPEGIRRSGTQGQENLNTKGKHTTHLSLQNQALRKKLLLMILVAKKATGTERPAMKMEMTAIVESNPMDTKERQ